MQVHDQASNVEFVPPDSQFGPVDQSFAQGSNQEVEIIFPHLAQQSHSSEQAQGMDLAYLNQGPVEAQQNSIMIQSQKEQRPPAGLETERQQRQDLVSLMQPMVAQLCQLLTKYRIRAIPSKEGDQSCAFSLTSPSLPEIMMSILPETHSTVKYLQLL
jgi:hypothetical protein